MAGVGTWPGGTNDTSGYLAALTLLGPGRLGRRLARGGAAAGALAAAVGT